MSNKYVKYGVWPPDHAQKAFDDGYYIEAIQITHSWIECKLQELIILTGSIDFNSTASKTSDIINENIGYRNAAHFLYTISQLTEKEYQDLLNFNSKRNKIIHDLFYRPWVIDDKKEIPITVFETAIKKGIDLCWVLNSKIESKV